eukprot:GHVH01016306.1.p1 GENE.GHVH01016306.1~~GHVH01016306.1.p1  ORF type:complete len:319 (+),score=48.94 GHVH01016306.1:156-1112(+)
MKTHANFKQASARLETEKEASQLPLTLSLEEAGKNFEEALANLQMSDQKLKNLEGFSEAYCKALPHAFKNCQEAVDEAWEVMANQKLEKLEGFLEAFDNAFDKGKDHDEASEEAWEALEKARRAAGQDGREAFEEVFEFAKEAKEAYDEARMVLWRASVKGFSKNIEYLEYLTSTTGEAAKKAKEVAESTKMKAEGATVKNAVKHFWEALTDAQKIAVQDFFKAYNAQTKPMAGFVQTCDPRTMKDVIDAFHQFTPEKPGLLTTAVSKLADHSVWILIVVAILLVALAISDLFLTTYCTVKHQLKIALLLTVSTFISA